ncbi:MAG: TetR/AcrR family transcriptional regulator [Candidatus Thiodiazotropha sp. (ex Lucinoma annulata)]|nr:TetR/AcrR family transcriptional regulator [Candidatus Thiodiazotropha sp. (ex Lucinoma borealis)]MCU7857200.1 TetR/AcrR family transcriptional regulator [Candidatus Thiodiazotropha sp. (ex Lucinoma borealis)]MCU7864296.1 TetR/AcrR family transcriptional regulator [Candidatus Thiodiazotropha sp. (ex Lucinoma borealis)]MCU7868527.1 TetR/AcrR family transcriptional regulator [Candidatus Thiodiazotropha sp. (ex Lucinoma borealis)]MCU7886073.1 TetR/AcrR family transcriptional regulator [Candidat
MPYLKTKEPQPETIDCKILSAALDLFVDDSYHNVTVHDIQKRADVSIGAIYHHFGSKEGIAKALYNRIIQEVDDLIDSVTETIESPSKQCEEIIKQLFEYTESHPNIIAFVFHAKHSEFLPGEPLMCNASPFLKMREIIRKGIECGEFLDTDRWAAASCIYGGAIRMMQLRLDGIIKKPITEYSNIIINAAWTGLKAEPGLKLVKNSIAKNRKQTTKICD